MKNMKIGKKLILSFIAVSIIASVSGIFSMFVIKNANSKYEFALVNYGFTLGDIGNAMLAVSDNNRCVRDIIGFTDQNDINTAKATFNENLAKYDEYVKSVKASLRTPEEEAQYENIETALATYRTKRDEVLRIGDTSNAVESARAQRIAVDQLDPLYEALYSEWRGLMDINVTTGNALNNQLKAQGNTSLLLSIGLTAGSIALSLLLGSAIAHSISRPVNACADRLALLSEGDLHAPIPAAATTDEIGIMLNSLKTTVDFLNLIIGELGIELAEIAQGNLDTEAEVEFKGDFNILRESMGIIVTSLNDTLSQIGQTSDQVASGSEQVSVGAQALSQGATRQASSIEELSAAITEISGQTRKNAENAENAKKQSEQAGYEVTESNQKMQDMIIAMNDISGKSQEIGKIIKTIDDIAFQTNILALNAAVEAARAGAAGKGFAVVADEVRNLAGKSATAAKNTATLIQEAIRSVENGTNIADDTAKAMLSVVKGTKAVSDLVEQIAAASGQQALSVNQVTQGVEQISSVVQNNSATAEESAAASQELSGQSQILKTLVGKFKLKANYAAASNNAPPVSLDEAAQYSPSPASPDDSKY